MGRTSPSMPSVLLALTHAIQVGHAYSTHLGFQLLACKQVVLVHMLVLLVRRQVPLPLV